MGSWRVERSSWESTFLSSGSHEHDSPFTVVAMEKEIQTGIVHEQRFGERERLAHETSQTLSQGVIPAPS